MTVMTKILTGAAGLAAMVGLATPASAQYYPSPYGNQGGGVLGAILNGVIGGGGQYGGQYGGGYGGYNSYGNNSQAAVAQCAGAVNARIQGQHYGGYSGGYGGNWGGYGNYGGGYNNYSRARVQQIIRVERRSNGGLKVYGLATSANAGGYNGGYNSGYGGYNGGYGQSGYADLKFNCKLDAYGRITDVDIDRYNGGYNNYGYRGY